MISILIHTFVYGCCCPCWDSLLLFSCCLWLVVDLNDPLEGFNYFLWFQWFSKEMYGFPMDFTCSTWKVIGFLLISLISPMKSHGFQWNCMLYSMTRETPPASHRLMAGERSWLERLRDGMAEGRFPRLREVPQMAREAPQAEGRFPRWPEKVLKIKKTNKSRISWKTLFRAVKTMLFA